MPCTIKNNSGRDLSQVTNLVNAYYPYAKQNMGFDRDAIIVFESDIKNAQNPLGKTAFYNPSNFTVTIYVDKRHPKDIMRSVSHELVHHHQNCQGKFENIGPTEEGYAQSDPYLRMMEKDAYLRGNLSFRDWENQKSQQLGENKKMTTSKKTFEELVRGVLRERAGKDSPDNLEPLEEKEEELEEADDWYMAIDKKEWEPPKPKKPKSDEDEDKKKRRTGEESTLNLKNVSNLEEGKPWDCPEGQVRSDETGDCVPDPGAGKGLPNGDPDEPLKEWYDNSIFNKLLKEYTKR